MAKFSVSFHVPGGAITINVEAADINAALDEVRQRMAGPVIETSVGDTRRTVIFTAHVAGIVVTPGASSGTVAMDVLHRVTGSGRTA